MEEAVQAVGSKKVSEQINYILFVYPFLCGMSIFALNGFIFIPPNPGCHGRLLIAQHLEGSKKQRGQAFVLTFLCSHEIKKGVELFKRSLEARAARAGA